MSARGTRPEGFFRRLGWSAFSTGAGFAASAVTALAVSHLVDPAEYGRAAVVTSTWGFLGVPILWCGSLVARFGPVELERSGRISRVLGTRLLFVAPAFAILAVAVPIVASLAAWSALLVWLTVGFLLASVAQDLGHWTAIAAQRFRAMALANVLTRGLPAMVVLAPFAIPFTVRAEHLLSATAGAAAVAAIVLGLSLRDVAGVGAPDRELLGRMWRYISPAALGVPATSIVLWADPIVLARFVPRSEVGHYQLAYLVMTMSALGTASLTAVLSPELVRANARGETGKQATFVSRVQPRAALALGLLGFAGACVVEPILLLVLGPLYAPSARLAAILCVAAGLQMATSTLSALATAADGQAASQTGSVLQAVVNLVGDIVLAGWYGATGVALANVLASAAKGVATSALLRRKVDLRLTPWLLLGGLAPAFLLFVTASPPLWARVAAAGGTLAAAALPARALLRMRRPGPRPGELPGASA